MELNQCLLRGLGWWYNHHDKRRVSHAGRGHLPATVLDWAEALALRVREVLGQQYPTCGQTWLSKAPISVPQGRTSTGMREPESFL